MPCYDKKLEAVRPNFTLGKESSDEIKEVDTVLATHELVDLISSLAQKEGELPGADSFSKIPFFQKKEDSAILEVEEHAQQFIRVMEMFVEAASTSQKFHQISQLNTTSNGYLEYIFRRAAKEIFDVTIAPDQPLLYTQGKNRDLKEVVLELPGGK